MQSLKCESGARYIIIDTNDSNSSKLHEKCSDISEDEFYDWKPSIGDILIDLYNTVSKTKKINWIALPQIWVMSNWFVMSGVDKNWNRYARIVINPVIVSSSWLKTIMIEECLSEPGVKKKIQRSYSLKVKYYNHNRKEVSDTISGFEARVFQHEYDHLQGILLSDK
jgi:peptide deformylase